MTCLPHHLHHMASLGLLCGGYKSIADVNKKYKACSNLPCWTAAQKNIPKIKHDLLCMPKKFIEENDIVAHYINCMEMASQNFLYFAYCLIQC